MKSLRYVCILTVYLLIGQALSRPAPPGAIVHGIITAGGSPLSGVSIVVKGTTQGTTTAEDGSFRLSVARNSVLVISHTGYQVQEIKVGNSDRTVNLSLTESRSSLDEIVVVGYGTRRKSEVTGAIVSVSAKAIQDVPSANLTQCAAGAGGGYRYSEVWWREPSGPVAVHPDPGQP
ncbi:carboxypeptidase-like regulatory domain-containing protein [Puia sp. P3]|uniref:carboxypeptidase-like regulatory domain-containing protein n=1 Tax=Puia sp. P3 TaxID=3423952 RepID=UPI003D664D7A